MLENMNLNAKGRNIISIVNCNISFQSKTKYSLRYKNQDSQRKSVFDKYKKI